MGCRLWEKLRSVIVLRKPWPCEGASGEQKGRRGHPSPIAGRSWSVRAVCWDGGYDGESREVRLDGSPD